MQVKPSLRSRLFRLLLHVAAWSTVLLLALVAWVAMVLPGYAERRAVAALRTAGFPDAYLLVQSVSPAACLVKNLQLSLGEAGITAESAEAGYSLRGLLAQRVAYARIAGLRLTAVQDAAGWHLAGFDSLFSARQETPARPSPETDQNWVLERLDLVHTQLQLQTARGVVPVALDVSVTGLGTAPVRVTGTIRVAGVTVNLRASVSADGRAGVLDLSARDASLAALHMLVAVVAPDLPQDLAISGTGALSLHASWVDGRPLQATVWLQAPDFRVLAGRGMAATGSLELRAELPATGKQVDLHLDAVLLAASYAGRQAGGTAVKPLLRMALDGRLTGCPDTWLLNTERQDLAFLCSASLVLDPEPWAAGSPALPSLLADPVTLPLSGRAAWGEHGPDWSLRAGPSESRNTAVVMPDGTFALADVTLSAGVAGDATGSSALVEVQLQDLLLARPDALLTVPRLSSVLSLELQPEPIADGFLHVSDSGNVAAGAMSLSEIAVHMPVRYQAQTGFAVPADPVGQFQARIRYEGTDSQASASNVPADRPALAAMADLQTVWRTDGSLGFSGFVEGADLPRVELKGAAAEFPGGPVRAEFATAPWRLTSANPAWRALGIDLTGIAAAAQVAVQGDVQMTAAGFGGRVTTQVEDGTFAMPSLKVQVEGIRGRLELSDLVEPRSRPHQAFSFTAASLQGMSVPGGTVVFCLESARRLFIEQAAFNWCGGVVRSYAVMLDQEKASYDLVLFAEKLQLSALLGLIRDFKGTAEGSLYGRLPVRVDKGRFRFRDGFLYAVPGQPGYVAMTDTAFVTGPLAQAGTDAVTLKRVEKALGDFGFNLFKIDLEGGSGTESLLRFRLAGASRQDASLPPVDLTFNVRGPLQQILNLGLTLQKAGGK